MQQAAMQQLQPSSAPSPPATENMTAEAAADIATSAGPTAGTVGEPSYLGHPGVSQAVASMQERAGGRVTRPPVPL